MGVIGYKIASRSRGSRHALGSGCVVCTCACACIHMHTRAYTDTRAYTCIHVHTHAYTSRLAMLGEAVVRQLHPVELMGQQYWQRLVDDRGFPALSSWGRETAAACGERVVVRLLVGRGKQVPGLTLSSEVVPSQVRVRLAVDHPGRLRHRAGRDCQDGIRIYVPLCSTESLHPHLVAGACIRAHGGITEGSRLPSSRGVRAALQRIIYRVSPSFSGWPAAPASCSLLLAGPCTQCPGH